MADRIRCQCRRCMINGLMGPVVLITVGFLFLIDQMDHALRFGRLWPVILLAVGGVKLAASLASTEGHISS
ncbi:MAG: DUF5668 domain-containing protein [Candidatus Acidiferrales bacterium]